MGIDHSYQFSFNCDIVTNNKIVSNLKLKRGVMDDNDGSGNWQEFPLGVLDKALEKLLDYNNRALKGIERLEYFISHEKNEFSRKDYMNLFKEISPATASRDLKKGVENGLLFCALGHLS